MLITIYTVYFNIPPSTYILSILYLIEVMSESSIFKFASCILNNLIIFHWFSRFVRAYSLLPDSCYEVSFNYYCCCCYNPFCHRSFNKMCTKLQSVSLTCSLSLPQALHHHLGHISGTCQMRNTFGMRHEVWNGAYVYYKHTHVGEYGKLSYSLCLSLSLCHLEYLESNRCLFNYAIGMQMGRLLVAAYARTFISI